MFKPVSTALAAAVLLAACGYKGDLYLPKEGDKAKFGVIQTGLGISAPAAASEPQPAPSATLPTPSEKTRP